MEVEGRGEVAVVQEPTHSKPKRCLKKRKNTVSTPCANSRMDFVVDQQYDTRVERERGVERAIKKNNPSPQLHYLFRVKYDRFGVCIPGRDISVQTTSLERRWKIGIGEGQKHKEESRRLPSNIFQIQVGPIKVIVRTHRRVGFNKIRKYESR